MFIYGIVVLLVVAIVTSILVFVFGKKRLLELRTLMAVALGSLLVGIVLPFTYDLLFMRIRVSGNNNVFIPTLVITLLVYMLLALVLSSVAMYMFPVGSRVGQKSETAEQAAGFTFSLETVRETVRETESDGDSVESSGGKGNYLEEIFDKHIINIREEDEKELESLDCTENNFEKLVDSDENIDKMGVEIYEQDNSQIEALEKLSINQCVDEAFRLKELGDMEGAILYHMYALDRKPAKDLVFWIVLDICVLYKGLGQIELACDILSNYTDSYGDLMDVSIKAEIERNLSSIQ